MPTLAVNDHSQRTLSEDIEELTRLLDTSYGRARDFYKEVKARHGDVPELASWKRIMEPAKSISRRGTKPARNPDRDLAWIKAHAHEFWGEWLAIYDGQLIAHGSDALTVVRDGREKSPQPDFLLFYAGEYPR
jgi:hypothetical protein